MTLFSLFKKHEKDSSRRDDLVQSFDQLALAPAQPHPDFVGGFNIQLNPASQQDDLKPLPARAHRQQPGPTLPAGTPARPSQLLQHRNQPSMPVPQVLNQSLTMQHALYGSPNGDLSAGHHSLPPTPRRPDTNTFIPSPSQISHSNDLLNTLAVPRPYQPRPYSDSALPSRPAPTSLPATPLKTPSAAAPAGKLTITPQSKHRPRASSTPASPTFRSSNEKSVQCSGVTKAGKRCTRQVKFGPPLSVVHPDVSLERFCFQHTKEVMSPSGFYSRKTADWIKFGDWIPDYLQHETQVSLRTEMEKARSQSDVPGYIYTFEIRDTTSSDLIHFKVGRAVNLVKRLDQWDKQCASKGKEHVLRGWWPGTVEMDEDGSLMKGRIKAGEKGMWCHRLERLIHLELADLVLYQPYLNPDFPKAESNPTDSNVNGSAGALNSRKKCPECGAMHKEIFSFKRVISGNYQDREWEKIVQPVIEKWGYFVEAYV